jgi:protein transport protein SEC24
VPSCHFQMVVTDVGEPFVPLKTGLFVPIHESREIIENLLMQLPHMFEHTKAIDSFFGAAIDVAVQAMEGTGGRMIVFSNSFPTIGPGMLKAREDHKMLGTDAEKSLFIPQIPFYSDKAEECVKHGVAVDLFMCQSTYVFLASFLARLLPPSVHSRIHCCYDTTSDMAWIPPACTP